MSEVSSENPWYYVRPGKTEPIGPVQADEIRFLFATNQITRRTLVWSAGMDDWKSLGDVGALQQTDRVRKLNLGFLGIHAKSSLTPPS
jgi:hypothetical protein